MFETPSIALAGECAVLYRCCECGFESVQYEGVVVTDWQEEAAVTG